jgi:hypothetical protein
MKSTSPTSPTPAQYDSLTDIPRPSRHVTDDVHELLTVAGSHFHKFFPNCKSLISVFHAIGSSPDEFRNEPGTADLSSPVRSGSVDSPNARLKADNERLTNELTVCQHQISELESKPVPHDPTWSEIGFSQFPPELSQSLSEVIDNPHLDYESKFRRSFHTIDAYYNSRVLSKSPTTAEKIDTSFLEKLSAKVLNCSIRGSEILRNPEIQEQILSALERPDPQIAKLTETIDRQKKRTKRHRKNVLRLTREISDLERNIQIAEDERQEEYDRVELEESDNRQKSCQTDFLARIQALEADNARLKRSLDTERSNIAARLAEAQEPEISEYSTLATFLSRRRKTQKERIRFLREDESNRPS